MFVDIPKELSKDPWFKVVGMLQQNWAVVVEREREVLVVFYGDTSGVFDQMPFDSKKDAEEALIRNGFSKYSDDPNVEEFLAIPRGEFYASTHPSGRIYSEGIYWK